jgi:hypothetical protein
MTALAAAPSPSLSAYLGTSSPAVGVLDGSPRLLLRLEGLVTLLAALSLYRSLGGSWGLLAALFLVPDLSFLAYLAGPRLGAWGYNAAHALLGPALLAAGCWALGQTGTPLQVSLIWVAHVGFDRLAGYGLKHETSFFDTHLGRVGTGAQRDARQSTSP